MGLERFTKPAREVLMGAGLWAVAALLIVLPVLAGLVTASSAALGAVSPVRADAMADDGLPGAVALAVLLRSTSSVMALLRLTRLALVASYVAVVSVIVLDRAGIGWLSVVLVVYCSATFPIVETIPRIWAGNHPDKAARRLAPVARTLHALPPTRLLSGLIEALFCRFRVSDGDGMVVSEDELIALTEEAAAGDEIEDQEREMIESVFALGDTVVREVMVPRTDMLTVTSQVTVSAALDFALSHGLSRVPITGHDIDDIVGVGFVKDLVRSERSTGEGAIVALMRRARFVPETKHAHELLREMQAGEHHLAIVVDEYGGTAGLVTLEDLIEELVGEIVDEYDHEEPIWETLVGGDVRVHGRMPVDQLNHLVGADLPEGDWDTVGGLIFDNLGRVPEVGEGIESGGVRLVVERMEGRRITRVGLTPPETTDPDTAAEGMP